MSILRKIEDSEWGLPYTERRLVYTVICARSLCTQGGFICRLASHAGSSSTYSVKFIFYNGATALVGQGLLIIEDLWSHSVKYGI
jgi:hypothetical protein